MSRTAAELAAIERDDPTCQRCRAGVYGRQSSLHHRKLRGRGTPRRECDLVENLVVLCGTGTTGCHGWVHANPHAAKEAGWIVPTWSDPAVVLCTRVDGTQFELTPGGTRLECGRVGP